MDCAATRHSRRARGAACCFGKSVITITIVVTLLSLRPAWVEGEACASGVLQLDPPSGDPSELCVNDPSTWNSVKAVCGVAFKVTAAGNTVHMVPLEPGTYNFVPAAVFLPSGAQQASQPILFDCKDINASGTFYSGSTTAASVMLYDDYTTGAGLSNLTRSGPNRVTLTAGQFYTFSGLSNYGRHCMYNYTVTRGCVLGAKPASTALTGCPPGHISKTGRYSLKFCSPCPMGTYSKGGTETQCKPCPLGTAGPQRGLAKCLPCEFGPTIGATSCTGCDANFGTKWTDRTTQCKACPEGSTSLRIKPNQCVKCYAGKKCCTVNWDKNCPRCTSDAKHATYTSIFALQSASPASCMASIHALCAPKMMVSVDGGCLIKINSINNPTEYLSSIGVECSWSNTVPIQGPRIQALRDLHMVAESPDLQAAHSPLDYGSPNAYSMLNGNVTAASKSVLQFSVLTSAGSCSFTYVALSKPAAILLGITPKPTPSSTVCPVGMAKATTTDTKPGACLPCRLGTYSNKAGVCTPCPAGTYSTKYSSTKCSKCPPGTYSKAGASACRLCMGSGQYASSDGLSCLTCPKNTLPSATGLANTPGTCLASAWGSTCCAAGACKGQTLCGPEVAAALAEAKHPQFNSIWDSSTNQALFRLKSRSISGATCKVHNTLKCMPVGTEALVRLLSPPAPMYRLEFTLAPVTPATCGGLTASMSGSIAGTNLATLSQGNYEGPGLQYKIVSNKSARSFTLYFLGTDRIPPPRYRPADPTCYATFELLEGFFLDLKPPAHSKCPPAGKLVKFAGGSTYCAFCGTGNFRNSKGACQPCPAGTHQPVLGSTTCKPCPKGAWCAVASHDPSPCSLGRYGVKAGKASANACLVCPAGTFTGYGPRTACSKCPAGTISATGSQACGVPFLTTF